MVRWIKGPNGGGLIKVSRPDPLQRLEEVKTNLLPTEMHVESKSQWLPDLPVDSKKDKLEEPGE